MVKYDLPKPEIARMLLPRSCLLPDQEVCWSPLPDVAGNDPVCSPALDQKHQVTAAKRSL